jgi:tRNA threonylcarbamoyladenosine modification (KEOPS) complex Cgi121 subunit
LLKFIEEFGRYLEIVGFKDIKIGNCKRFLLAFEQKKTYGVDVQFFDANQVAGWEHLYFAALNALTAFENHENISKSLAMETLLYAAAEKQIVKATERVGIRSTTKCLAVLIIGKKLKAVKETLSMISKHVAKRPEDRVLELSKEKIPVIKKIFDIENTELETVTEKGDVKRALTDLLIEMMALSTTRR